jgi:hypothetical protein
MSKRAWARSLVAFGVALVSTDARAGCAADRECDPGQACLNGTCGEPPLPAPMPRPSPVSFGLGGGLLVTAQGNVGGGPVVDGLVNLALTPLVDVRLAASLAAGSFATTAWEEECATPGGQLFFVQQWSHGDRLNAFALVPTGLFSVRFNLTSFYAIALGFRAGAVLYPDPPGGEATACGVETGKASPRLWFAPELSLLSFRFGDRRELEIESSGGLLLPTEGAGTKEHALPGNGPGGYVGVTFHYLFVD